MASPICPGCGCEGIHGTVDGCITALRKALAQYAKPPPTPSVEAPPPRPLSPERLRRVRSPRLTPVPSPVPEWVTINQACAIVQVSRETIDEWIRTGKVEHRRHAGGSPRIRASSLWPRRTPT